MPYNTRSSGRKSVSSDAAPSTPIRRASSSREPQPSPIAAATPSHHLLRTIAIPKEDSENEVLMAVVNILAEQKDSKPLPTSEMAKLTPHKANAISTCIRAHLRRDSPHLIVRHDPADGKIPTYSLNVPLSPSAERSQNAASAVAPLLAPAQQATHDHSDMAIDDDDSSGLHDDFELDVDIDDSDAVKMEDQDDFFETFSSPAGSASPVITPPPPLSSSIPRLRSHFVENLLMPSRGISPDATSDGSSPPSTPRSPSSPLISAKAPLSPTTGILSQGFKAMLLSEPKDSLESYASSPVLDVNAGFFPTMTMVGPGFHPSNTTLQEDYLSFKQSAVLSLQAFTEPVAFVSETKWESGEDWMMGPESMPIDELDRELSAAWH